MFESIEKILNMKKIRYEIMDHLLFKIMKQVPKESNINIIIDLPSTIKQLYNPANIESLTNVINKNQYIISSCILNMVGHYRHYFASRHQCYTTIFFIINSKQEKEIQSIFPDYKKTYYEKRINLSNKVFGGLNSVMKDNYKVIKSIIEYLPHVYFIDSLDIDYRGIFPFLYEECFVEDDYNFILTTDKIFYQDALNDNTFIIEPKGNDSNVINKYDIIREIVGKSKTIEKHPEYLNIHPENIILIESLINQKDFDITGYKNFSYIKALSFLYKNEIDVSERIDNSTSIKELFKDIMTSEEIDETKKRLLVFNNKMIFTKNSKKLNLLIDSSFVDIDKPKEVRKVNERFFAKFPLITEYMWEGEVK